MIYTESLFERILLEPAVRGADRLIVITGYASPGMVGRHMKELRDRHLGAIDIELVIGMTALEGMSRWAHQGFVDMTSIASLGSFKCSYVVGSKSIHSKAYIWCSGSTAIEAYIGSANYSQEAFGIGTKGRRGEIMQASDPHSLMAYYESVAAVTMSCNEEGIEEHVDLFDQLLPAGEWVENSEIIPGVRDIVFSESVDLPLLDSRTMETPARSGINHGQRPRRDHSQAYIAIPTYVQRTGFFPAAGVHFTVVADDRVTLIMARGGEGGKNMMTPESNSILGKYLRRRLGLAEDAYVNTQDLLDYGRTSVTFSKVDDDTYYMDFSGS